MLPESVDALLLSSHEIVRDSHSGSRAWTCDVGFDFRPSTKFPSIFCVKLTNLENHGKSKDLPAHALKKHCSFLLVKSMFSLENRR